jgi:hypothetical protein
MAASFKLGAFAVAAEAAVERKEVRLAADEAVVECRVSELQVQGARQCEVRPGGVWLGAAGRTASWLLAPGSWLLGGRRQLPGSQWPSGSGEMC